MKKNLFKLVISLIFVVMTVVCLSVFMLTDASADGTAAWDGVVASGYAGGTGSSGNPYQIATPGQWAYFVTRNNDVSTRETGKYYVLTADIVFNTGDASTWGNSFTGIDTNAYRIGTVWSAGDTCNVFSGNFNGQGHCISGFYMSTATEGGGLFTSVCGDTTTVIKNLVVTNSYFKADSYVGAIIGQTSGKGTTVESCFVTDSVYIVGGSSAGGLIGGLGQNSFTASRDTVIRKCVNGATITITGNVAGGIVGNGNNAKVQISDCMNYGAISGYDYLGGIMGQSNNSSSRTFTFDNCINIYRPESSYDKASIYHMLGYTSASNTQTSRYPIFRNCVTPGSISRRTHADSSGNINTGVDGNTNAQDSAALLARVIANNFLTSDTAGTALNSNSNWTQVTTSRTMENETASFSELCFPTSICEMLEYNYNVLRTSKRSGGKSITSSGYTFLNSNSISITSKVEYIKFVNYFAGYYTQPCLNGAAGKTITLSTSLAFNTDKGNASTWGTSFSGNDLTGYIIGSAANPFRGTFNGNNKTISGFYVCTDSDFDDGTALFSQAEDATIRNLKIDNSCFKSERRKVSALVGEIIGTTNISNIYVTNSVYVIAQYGTRAGIVSTLNDRCSSTISNCVNEATISVLSETAADQNYCGGIIGNGNTGLITINDCLNLSAINGNNFIGGIAGSIANNSSRVNRCVNLGEVATNNNYGQVSNSGTAGTTVTFTDCFGLTATVGGRNTSGNYTQITLATFIYPGFLSDAGSALSSNWTARSSATDNGNNTTTYVLELCVPSGVSGFAPRSVYYNTYTLSNFSFAGSGTDVDPYIITTVAEFNEFATEAQSQNFSGLYIVLGNDITVNTGTSSSWLTSFSGTKLTPIGTEGTPFAGNFDGQGHTFSGVYMNQNVGGAGYGMGIFGVIGNGAVIKNFKIVNSCFVDEEWVGAVVGEMNGGTIDNIYVSSDVYVKATAQADVGGIAGGGVGTAGDSRVIQNCVFKGTVTGTDTSGTGGIVGCFNNRKFTVDNCLMTGTVSSAAGTTHVGGIFGYNNYDGETTVTNTVFAGSGSFAYPIGDNNTQTLTISGCYSTSSASNQYKSSATGSAGVMKMPSATNYYSSGSGTAGSPYIIDNWAQFIILAYEIQYTTDGFSGKYFKLNADIEVNDGTAATDWTPDNALIPIGDATHPFKGNFDGNKKTISGVYILTDSDFDDGTALFSQTQGATIQNLIITNSLFKTERRKVSALVGEIVGVNTIQNIYVTDSVYIVAQYGTRAGIISTLNDTCGSTISGCVNAANISVLSTTASDQNYCGGIVGNGNKGLITINDCLNLSEINGNNFIGGIAGSIANDDSRVNRCVNLGEVATNNNYGQISNSGTAGTTVTFANCFGITETVGGRNTSGTYTQVTVDQFITKGFLTGTGSTLASNWTNRAGNEISFCGTTIASDAREICIPNGLSSFTLPNSPLYGKAPEWLLEAYEDGTFTVSTKADYGELVKFINNDYSFDANGLSGKTVELGDDISFNTGSNASGWGASAPTYDLTDYVIGTFKGEFDGCDCTISGFYVSTTEKGAAGLFRVINGTIHDLKLTNSYFYTEQHTIGALAAQVALGATVENIYVTNSVYVTANGASPNGNTGGLVGAVNTDVGSGTVSFSGCLNAATVKAEGSETVAYRQAVGGILGTSATATLSVTSCMNAGLVSGSYYVGGIVGRANEKATFSQCVNIGTVIGDSFVDDNNDEVYNKMYVYADIATGNVISGRTVTLVDCYGLNSRLFVSRQSSGTKGTVSFTNVNQTSLRGLFGSNAPDIEGFTKRDDDVPVPSGVASYASSDKFFTIKMENGASVRTSTPYGIRFIADLNVSAFTNITEYGILYGPTSEVAASGFNPSSLTLKTQYVKVPSLIRMNEKTYEDDGYYRFSLAVNVAEKNFYKDFSARAYVVANGVTYYSEYVELNNSRSVSNVARLACEDVSSSNGNGYTYAIGTVYSCYSPEKRSELNKYFSTEVRVMQAKLNGTSSYPVDSPSGTTSVANFVKEVFQYNPDVILLSGANGDDLSALTSTYTISEATENAAIRVLYKTERFTKVANSEDVQGGIARYIKLTDNITGKTSFYASVDYGTPATDTNTMKNNTTVGNSASVGLILGGGFQNDGDSDLVTNGYLTSAHATAPTQYYVNYFTRHDTTTGDLAIHTGVLCKSAYAEAKRFRISDDPFGAYSHYHAIICDYILK